MQHCKTVLPKTITLVRISCFFHKFSSVFSRPNSCGFRSIGFGTFPRSWFFAAINRRQYWSFIRLFSHSRWLLSHRVTQWIEWVNQVSNLSRVSPRIRAGFRQKVPKVFIITTRSRTGHVVDPATARWRWLKGATKARKVDKPGDGFSFIKATNGRSFVFFCVCVWVFPRFSFFLCVSWREAGRLGSSRLEFGSRTVSVVAQVLLHFTLCSTSGWPLTPVFHVSPSTFDWTTLTCSTEPLETFKWFQTPVNYGTEKQHKRSRLLCCFLSTHFWVS